MNRVVHFEIHAKDLDKAQQFYSEVFGWTITNLGEQIGNYRIVETGESTPGEKWPGINGGIAPRSGEPASSGQPVNAFVCTISVDDIDLYIDKVKKAGGIIIPDTAKEKPQRGTVIAAGPGKKDEPVTVKVGDTVLYGKYSGTEIQLDGDDLLIMRESDILAIV